MKYPLISEHQRNREYLLELLLLAVSLSLAVNLVSGWIADLMGDFIPGFVGLIAVAFCVSTIAALRFRRRAVNLHLEATFVLDKNGHPVPIAGYHFAEEFCQVIDAVFAENEALRQQWESEPPNRTDIESVWEKRRSLGGGYRLVREVAEYIVLDKISEHVQEYFRADRFVGERLQCYTRESVPDVLLNNRVLELISRDVQDRPAFSSTLTDNKPGVVVISQHGPDGYYNRFELTLPKGTRVGRTEDGGVVFENRAIRFEVRVDFEGFCHYLDSTFCQFLIRESYRDLDPRVVGVIVNASLKWRFIFTRQYRTYHWWIESLLTELEDSIALDAFKARIGWDQTGPLLAALTEHEKSSAVRRSSSGVGSTSEQ